MTEEILINVTPRETRVAVVENGMLQELHIERGWSRGVVGNIYKGKVQRVMPGMQAAFVDIGLERAAFLHATDILRPPPARDVEGDRSAPAAAGADAADHRTAARGPGDRRAGGEGSDRQQGRAPDHAAQHSLALPGPAAAVARGRRVGADRGRGRARPPEDARRPSWRAPAGAHGYIVRTNAEGQPAEALAEDIAYLSRAWALIEQQVRETTRVGARVYEDLSLPMRAVRDLMRRDVEKVKVDSRETCERLRAFAAQYMPGLAEKIEHYSGARPVFDLYGVEDEIQRALREGSAAEIRRLPGHRPDRGDDHGRRQHRLLPRPAQPRGDGLPHQPRSGAGGRAAAAAAQPRRHHHHRLHRHARCRAPAPGAAHAGEVAGQATTPRPPSTTSRRWAWSR